VDKNYAQIVIEINDLKLLKKAKGTIENLDINIIESKQLSANLVLFRLDTKDIC